MKKRVAIVMGAFHREKVERMLAESKKALQEAQLEVISEVWVPGSLEKPLALKRLLLRSDIDGAVVLGIIERGETKHGLVMGEVVMQAIIDLQLQTMKPVGVGILGPEILPEQIEPRLLPYAKAAAEALAVMLK
jgi:6,7-dimethyl-8-ribityllumazine synthase